MKNLIKFAVGAAIAGALVNMLMNRRSMATNDEGQLFNDMDDENMDDNVELDMSPEIEPERVASPPVLFTQPEVSAPLEDSYGAQAGDSSRH